MSITVNVFACVALPLAVALGDVSLFGAAYADTPADNAAVAQAKSGSPVQNQATLQLHNPAVGDQDDMCIWRNNTAPERSTIIASDKKAGHLFVYDLAGQLLQTVDVPKPGNIDLRQNVAWGNGKIDLVVVNDRKDNKLRVLKVIPESRLLEFIDDGGIPTGPNYGGTLGIEPGTKALHFVCTAEKGQVEQYLLTEQAGVATGKLVRTWPIKKCEGAVCDDETGTLYIAEETGVIWSLPLDPKSETPGKPVAGVGEHGLVGDLEGLALWRANGQLSLVVSNQGASEFVVLSLTQPGTCLGRFKIPGVSETDGLELSTADFGPEFPGGIFCCHTNLGRHPVIMTPLQHVSGALTSGQETR